jgi:TPP-dependent pyruvate/acetoin dehydrogenase alpha subunit
MTRKTKEELIAFEERIQALFETGKLPFLVHLSGGNESQLIGIFRAVKPGDWVFSGHRSHYHYLLSGGSEEKLEKFIRNGDSMFVFDRELNFVTSSVLAGLACPAAGVAAAIKERNETAHVWCFVGDGAEDEGHFYEAVRYVDGHKLPCTFVIEDNDRSCDTTIAQRRGVHSEFVWPSCVIRYHYTPTYPHGGTGCKTWVKFDDQIVNEICQANTDKISG